jgi:transcriptional regulator with XRE-family HTH domain
MSTGEAISKLREKLGQNQKEFAETLGVTVTTVSRYENGREPTSRVLEILASLAEKAGARHLGELFAAKRRSDIANRVENLSSAGSARRVSAWELQALRRGLHVLELSRNIVSQYVPKDIHGYDVVAIMTETLERMQEIVEPYVDFGETPIDTPYNASADFAILQGLLPPKE